MKKSQEEKRAEQIASLVSDLRIDLDEVGIALARMRPTTIYNRLVVLMDSAEEEMEKENGRNTLNY